MNDEHNEEEKFAGLTAATLARANGAPAVIDNRFTPAGTETTATTASPVAREAQTATPLFAADEAKDFRVRWDGIQGDFVDEPRRAVEHADSLVAGAMQRLAEIFADERAKLEGQWGRDESVSTENLRLALRRYRSFFDRLLSV